MSETDLYEEPPSLEEAFEPPSVLQDLRSQTDESLTTLYRNYLNWQLIKKIEAHENRVPTDWEVSQYCSYRVKNSLHHYFWKGKWLFAISLRLHNEQNEARIFYNDTQPPPDSPPHE